MDAAEDIFGANLQVLKGQTTRTKYIHVRGSNLNIYLSVLEQHKDVQLTRDIMFVNGIHFFITKLRNLLFSTVEHIPNGKNETLLNSIQQIKNISVLGL